jgi:hypothetical protein
MLDNKLHTIVKSVVTIIMVVVIIIPTIQGG